jgi:hypothetical protein
MAWATDVPWLFKKYKMGNTIHTITENFWQPFIIINVEHDKINGITVLFFNFGNFKVTLTTGTPISIKFCQGGFTAIRN